MVKIGFQGRFKNAPSIMRGGEWVFLDVVQRAANFDVYGLQVALFDEFLKRTRGGCLTG